MVSNKYMSEGGKSCNDAFDWKFRGSHRVLLFANNDRGTYEAESLDDIYEAHEDRSLSSCAMNSKADY